MALLLATSPLIITGLSAALIAICGCVILMGKGDWLIAGYNTASKEKKAKVNIKRLRWLTAIVCWISAIYCMILPILKTDLGVLMLTFGFVAVVLLMLILANTWAKKR